MNGSVIYYAYGSWYDGGTDIGYFSTRTKAIIAIYDFLVTEQYTHTCFVVKHKINESLREYNDGGYFYATKDSNKVFKTKSFFKAKIEDGFEPKLREETKELYNKWKEGMKI